MKTAEVVSSSGDIQRIDTGGMVTISILADTLPLYQQAADTTGFRVTPIARPGESYLGRRTADLSGGYLLKEHRVLEGMLGISIEKPSGVVDPSAFWHELQRLQEVKAQSEQPQTA